MSKPMPLGLRSWISLLLIPLSVGLFAAESPLRHFCNTDKLRATYIRNSGSPRLLIFNKTMDEPCATVKLSCRLRTNTQSVIVVDAGTGKKRVPIGGAPVRELMVFLVLSRAPIARPSLAAGSGLVIENVTTMMSTPSEANKIPTSCMETHSRIRGYAQEYIRGVQNTSPKLKTFLKWSDASKVSLALTLISDALTGNLDRFLTGKNVFRRKEGSLISLDNCCWSLQCTKEETSSMLQMLHHPPLFTKAKVPVNVCKDQRFHQLYEIMHMLLLEICGDVHGGCKTLEQYVKESLLNDPLVQHQEPLGEPRLDLMCCSALSDKRFSHVLGRSCKSCTHNTWNMLMGNEKPKSCGDDGRGDNPIEVLATDSKEKVQIALNWTSTLLHKCGTTHNNTSMGGP